MARVAIAYDDYVEGRLPAVCLISGRPTEDVFVLRVEVPPPVDRETAPTGFAGGLEKLISVIDIRKPKRVLLGRIPVDRVVWQRLLFRQRAWAMALIGGAVALVASAWAAAAWSPFAAAVSAALVVVAALRRREWKRKVPKPYLTHGGSRVTLDRVHPAFAAAVAGPP